MNKYKFRIKPTILLVISSMAILSVLLTLIVQYYFSKELANKAVLDKTNFLSENTALALFNIDKTANELISHLKYSDKIVSLSQIDSDSSYYKEKFTISMTNNNFIYAIYVGYANGDFYEIINLEIDELLKIKFDLKENEKWLKIKISTKNNRRIKEEFYLDDKLNVIRTKEYETEYNPIERPWFKKALNSEAIIQTEPYVFSNLGAMGVTYAKNFLNDNLVIGIDISLKSLSQFLQKQNYIKGTKLFIHDKNGKIIASNIEYQTNLTQNEQFLLNASKAKYHNNIIIFDNEEFIVNTKLLSSNKYLSILIPKNEIMKPYNETIFVELIVTFIFLLIMIPFIYYFTTLIVRPIQNIQLENEKIKKRDYESVIEIKTSISEISELSKSLVSMSNSIQKYEQEQIRLMDSFIELIAGAIDEKSEYTGGHCKRVPYIAIELAKKASESKDGIFKDFQFNNKDELRELTIAAWLHDCGKVVTPEYVVDKATKLETIYNRIHEIRTRFEVVFRDKKIEYYKELLSGKKKDELDEWLNDSLLSLQRDFEFIAKANIGGEYMTEDDKKRVIEISKISWIRNFDNTIGLSYEEENRLKSVKNNTNIEYLLEDKPNHIIPRKFCSIDDKQKYKFNIDIPENNYNLGEIYNLCISRGTLTNEERFKINEHIITTIKMLKKLPLPESLKNIPEYAGAHHETLIGTGYPRKLTKDEMSIPSRIMALADIFEALTSSDRPYKQAKSLSESIKIMKFMVNDKHIDEDIFKLFLLSGIYLSYAEEFLLPEQIDYVDINKFL